MNYISNIDTICILIDTENFEQVSVNILERLQKEKELAKSNYTRDANYKHLININNLDFYLSPSGTKGYSYILQNTGFQINLAQFRSKLENFAPIQVRISSEYLWAYGLSTSWSIIHNWIVETFGNISIEKVFRIDLCSHISAIDFVTDYCLVYKGNFKKKQIFYTGNSISAITFGSRKSKNIYCRIYNKTLEIQEMKHKSWFYEIWENNHLDINNVWNIEFEIKSECLRQFNINTVEDILTHLQSLWKYCTTKWLVKVDRINERIERCPINSDWQDIQRNYDKFHSFELIKAEKQLSSDANILVPNIVGNITSYSARKKKININEAFYNLYFETKKYLRHKDTCFEDEVNKKIAFLGKSEVIKNVRNTNNTRNF